MKDWNEFKKELLKDPEVRKEYDMLTPYYEVISQVIGARIKRKLTQKQLAEKVGTKQSAIARFESGNSNPSLDFLQKIASAMGYQLSVKFH